MSKGSQTWGAPLSELEDEDVRMAAECERPGEMVHLLGSLLVLVVLIITHCLGAAPGEDGLVAHDPVCLQRSQHTLCQTLLFK